MAVKDRRTYLYWIDPRKEQALLGLIECQVEALRRLDLFGPGETPRLLRGEDTLGRRLLVHTIPWRDAKAAARAEAEPQVVGVQRALRALCEEHREARGGAPLDPGLEEVSLVRAG